MDCKNCKKPYRIVNKKHGLCGICNQKRLNPFENLQKQPAIERKPFSSSKPPQKKIMRHKRLKPRSAKREAENKIYLKLREQFLKDNPHCEVYPYFYSNEVHHKYSGKDRAKHFLDVQTWMAVSREAHNWIHAHPKEARDKGYLK